MIDRIDALNTFVNNLVWGVPAIICVLGVGIFLTFRSKLVQFRKLGYAVKIAIGKLFTKSESADGATTPFQSLTTALAATVGTGNIAGIAGAIAIGGPGAVFWMWIAALLGMCTKFAEVTLAVNFRERNVHGDWVGGPMYYIKNGLSKKWIWLSYAYACLGVLTVFGTGNATQVNTITTAIDAALLNYNIVSANSVKTVNLVIGIIITILILIILLGGIKRIGAVTEKLVPFMAGVYIILGLGVVFINIKTVPHVFQMIFEGAFSPSAATGGVVGSMFLCMKKGVSRGIFSNEAGLGTGSISHASAHTDEPVRQGLYSIFEVFIDTIVICTLTALVILCGVENINFGQNAGADLTIKGFMNTYGGWVSIFTAVALICFAFSTVLGWGLYGSRCIEYLFGSHILKPFTVIYAFIAILGATLDLGLIWDVAETFNGLMLIPNLIGVFLLSGTFIKLVKDYFSRFPVYDKNKM